MGIGSSVPAHRALQASQRSPELNGKKALHCPVTSSIVHPTTKDRWFLMVYASPNFYGLVFAARNMSTQAMLVKEFTDADLVHEKESQSISMSWNVFFKAVSTDIAAASGDGATCTFAASGCLSIAIKIQLAGAPAGNRRTPDVFRCDLMPVDSSPANVFRYFLEPLAIFACKRRTDLIDRPDPAKEKHFGLCEAAAITKRASGLAAEKKIAEHLRKIDELKDQLCKLRSEKRLQVARTTAAEMLLRRPLADDTSTGAELLSIINVAPEHYEDPLLLDIMAGKSDRPTTPPPPPLFPDPVTGHGDLPAAEADFSVAAKTDTEDVAGTAMYILRRFVPAAALQLMKLHEGDLHRFFLEASRAYPSAHLRFSARRATFVLRTLLNQLASSEGFSTVGDQMHLASASGHKKISSEGILVLVLSAVCVGLHRPRMTGDLCSRGGHFLSSLYPESPLANHSVAVLYSLAVKHKLVQHGSVFCSLVPSIVQLVALVDEKEESAQHPDSPVDGSKSLRGIFRFCIGAHEDAPGDAWRKADVQYLASLGASAMCLGVGGTPTCLLTPDPSSGDSIVASPLCGKGTNGFR